MPIFRQRADCRSLLRRLPTEILGEILSLCIGVASDDVDFQPLDLVFPDNQAQGALSRACAQWRAIAVATPAYWCTIYVYFQWSDSHYRRARASTIGLFWIVAAMAVSHIR